MATYKELNVLFTDALLRDRVETAIVIAAEGILSVDPTGKEAEVQWAADVIANSGKHGSDALKLVLAANKDISVANIQGASDSNIQSNVDDMVDALVLAFKQSHPLPA